MDDITYNLSCQNGHDILLTPTALQSFLEEGNFECEECHELLSLDDKLVLKCQVCDGEWEVSDLDEAASVVVDELCSHCEEFTQAHFYVPGSHAEAIAEYQWTADGVDTQPLKREGRKDYWEGLIHFCTREQFVSIINSNTIKANPTGLYQLPAVCLTETPSTDCSELQAVHGEYGIMFRKNHLMKVGANPALYMLPNLVAAQGTFAPELRPFVNIIRTRVTHPEKREYDFLHEREWRVPHDIDLRTTPPIGIVLPNKPDHVKFGGLGGDTILRAAKRYQEL